MDTIDFMLSPNRDLVAAKQFLQLALHRTGRVRPRVINGDGRPAYATAIAELKTSGGWESDAAAGHPVCGWRAKYDRGS